MSEKLNIKRTILIGTAFLSICAFWQMYNNVIPLILTNTFHLNETWSGVIMAADNVLALFLLPLFGGISDRCSSRMGRRLLKSVERRAQMPRSEDMMDLRKG
jgi:Na+/melibiose symporter-like transporter